MNQIDDRFLCVTDPEGCAVSVDLHFVTDMEEYGTGVKLTILGQRIRYVNIPFSEVLKKWTKR